VDEDKVPASLGNYIGDQCRIKSVDTLIVFATFHDDEISMAPSVAGFFVSSGSIHDEELSDLDLNYYYARYDVAEDQLLESC
jgi:hypothetical protein